MPTNAITTDRWAAIATERRRLAADLATLSDDQWATPTVCDAWTVEGLLAHVVTPLRMSKGQFFSHAIKSRFNIDKMALATTAATASSATRAQLLAELDERAEDRWTPPGPFGVEIPLSEIVVHAQDIRHALGLGCPIPEETVEATLAGIKKDALRTDYEKRIRGGA